MKYVLVVALFCVAAHAQLIAPAPDMDPDFGVINPNRVNNTVNMINQSREEVLPKDFHACYVGMYVNPITQTFPDNVTARMATSDTVALALCSGKNSTCVNYNYTLTLPSGVQSEVMIGDCVPENLEQYYTCESLINATKPFGDASNCKVQTCSERGCNKIEVPRKDQKVCRPTPENDLQLMPACTMIEFGIKLNECHQMLYSGYPYVAESLCENNLDKAAQCLMEAINTCSDSQCPSAIDIIPGAKSKLESLRSLAYIALSEEKGALEILDIVADYLQIPPVRKLALMKGFLEFECPSSFGETPDLIQSWFEWAKITDIEKAVMEWAEENLGWVLKEYSPCVQGYHSGQVRITLDYWMQFYTARTRAQVCEAWTTKTLREQRNFMSKCQLLKVDDWVMQFLPAGFKIFTDDVVKAIYILGYGLSQDRITDCPAGSTNDVGCEEFYKLETACGIRKAWMCDYTQWKTSFLFDWLTEFEAFEIENILSDASLTFPSCDLWDMSDMCKNVGQQVCGTVPVTNCTTCYCKDQEYKDLSGLSEQWRKDYVEWRQVFSDYKKAFKQSTCKDTLAPQIPDKPDTWPEEPVMPELPTLDGQQMVELIQSIIKALEAR